MQQMTTEALVGELLAVKGSTFVGVIAVTDPYNGKPLQKNRVTGEPNPYLDPNMPGGSSLVKVQRGTAAFNVHYNRAVEKRVANRINLERAEKDLPPLEGDELKAAVDERFRKGDNWQQVEVREDGTLTPFAVHKTTGERYLRTLFYRTLEAPVYVDVKTGLEVPYTDDLKNVLPVVSANKNQGLPAEEVARYNCWKLFGIRGLRMNKQAFRIRPPYELEAEAVYAALNRFLAQIDIPEPPPTDEDGNPLYS